MVEEHEFQATEGHKLCANNCGFSGSLTTSDLCSKCQRDLRMKSEQNAIAKAALDTTPSPLTASASSSSAAVVIPALKLPESASEAADRADLVQSVSTTVQNSVNRCVACRKRVGLTGFKCRCGSTFCGSHRYPEKHDCTFDYKTKGKEAIAKANPVVKAVKLRRI